MKKLFASPVLVALDTTDLAKAKAWVDALSPHVGGFKIGNEFFFAQGPEGVRQALGTRPFFFDQKWHDIPNTVAGALRASLPLKPTIVNVHASGGLAMMQAAKTAADEAVALGLPRPAVIAVTVLTSMSDGDLQQVGQQGPSPQQVLRLARLAAEAGLDGVVASPQEIAAIRAACGKDFLIVTPGVRPAWAAANDQKRTMTPAEAIAAGADYLVIGRPITAAADPIAAAQKIAAEIKEGQS